MAESPAETLRRAAKLMRERAEAAMRGPWMARGAGADICVTSPDGQVAAIERMPVEGGWGDAEHVASWHPGVALAVANVLDNEAHAAELVGGDTDAVNLPDERILKLARAYLGEAQP